METKETTKMKKQVSHAFRKDIFLLGRLKSGERFWLEAPSWDCGWYWGFGYVETYTSDNPARARDIQSHSHYKGYCFHKSERGEYMHILSDNPDVQETVLTREEEWQLSDYMKSFYTLKEAAEVFHRGNSHVSGQAGDLLKDEALAKRINEVELPKLFAAIKELLEPKAE